ncbi:histone-lysine N-methyltransferase setd3 isoform X2 [Zootermopsis nevadensis]|uniref:histone-lysine N-methyltransferase setd3 isoform X2 n=1 Tax=Zootermopsis nevadensis TaxID=136037 RepID=UPI000B8E2656|nr:histone-lysine N-methyltransferase setd3 isoform X2 [Zootermopsis nevadensis]
MIFILDMRILVADRGTRIEEFETWMKENGAEIDGIEIAQFPNYEYGIKANKNFSQGDLLIAVPRKVMLTAENVEGSLLGPLLQKDAMLQHMPNVALSLLLLIEKFKPDSFWKPYIAVLPTEYTTVLYFKTNELQELKGSPSLEPALKQCRNIARQYAYFNNLFQHSSDPASNLLREVFTYDLYCWAVSTVMTRQNFVPSIDGNSMLNALIPMWDMCNHTNGKLSTDFNAEKNRSECVACRDYKAGEQIFIFYGPRTNSELFVHNGFVYPENEHDGLRLRLGISRGDLLQAKRVELLGHLGIPAIGDFMLKKGPDPVDGRLLAFLRVFSMGPEHLNHWLSSDHSSDLVYPDCALETDVESKMWKFLLDRINLLQHAYTTTLEEDCTKLKHLQLTPCSRLAVQLLITEKKLLEAAEEHVKQRIKT